jgi:hypothetical protein
MSERPEGFGMWRLRVYAARGSVSGHRQQHHRTFRGTKTEARRELARLVAKVGDHEFHTNKVTVGELLDRWLEHIEALGKARPKTLHEYKSKIAKKPDGAGDPGGIREVLGNALLWNLQADKLDQCYQRWLDSGLSPSTVHVYHLIPSGCVLSGREVGLNRERSDGTGDSTIASCHEDAHRDYRTGPHSGVRPPKLRQRAGHGRRTRGTCGCPKR